MVSVYLTRDWQVYLQNNELCEKKSLLVSVSADLLIHFASYVVSPLCLSMLYDKACWSEKQAYELFNMN